MTLFAHIISKVLNPFTASLATIFVTVYFQTIPNLEKLAWFLAAVFVATIPVAVLYIDHKRKGKMDSFWSPEGDRRITSFWAWIFVALLYILLIYFFHGPRDVVSLASILLLLGVVNLLLVSLFKISIHCELITLFVFFTMLSFSLGFIYLSVFILLTAWARLYLKAHTFSQVVAGIGLPILVTYLVLNPPVLNIF